MRAARPPTRLAASFLRPPSVAGRDWKAQAHLYLFRLACAICALLIPSFGVLFYAAEPAAADSLWVRLIAMGGSLALLGASYFSVWVQRHAAALLFGFSFVLTASFALLAFANGFATNYAVGYFVVWIGVTMFVSLAFDRVATLTIYIGFSLLITIALIVLHPAPGVDAAVYVACMLSAAAMIYVAVTARIQVQEAMEDREAHLAEAQRVAGLGNWEVEPSTGRVYWSAELFRLLGLDPDRHEASFQRLTDVLHFDDRAAFFRFWDALHAGQEAEDLMLRVGRDGRTRTFRVSGAYDPGERGQPPRLYGICLDVTAETERTQTLMAAKEAAERAREQAEAAQQVSETARSEAEAARRQAEEMARLKSAFLANMSHEIRTPLTAIIGFAQVLAEDVPAEQRDLVEPIEQSGRRLLTTLNSVLDLARLRSDAVALALEPVDVAEEAHEVAALLRPMAQGKGLTLTVAAPVQGVVAQADRSALHRVLTNLLSNAIKFTDAGRVTLSVEPRAERVVIRVRDTGRGIGPEFLPNLFEEFRQESSGVARSHEGSGLGLAITKGLVELMGGTISVESELGTGSVFTVALPVAVAPPVQAPAAVVEAS